MAVTKIYLGLRCQNLEVRTAGLKPFALRANFFSLSKEHLRSISGLTPAIIKKIVVSPYDARGYQILVPPEILRRAFSQINDESPAGVFDWGPAFVLEGFQIKTYGDLKPYFLDCLKKSTISGAYGYLPGGEKVMVETYNPFLPLARRIEAFLVEPNPPEQPRLGLVWDFRLYRVSEDDWLKVVMPLEAYYLDRKEIK